MSKLQSVFKLRQILCKIKKILAIVDKDLIYKILNKNRSRSMQIGRMQNWSHMQTKTSLY